MLRKFHKPQQYWKYMDSVNVDSESAINEKLNRNINSILLRIRVPKADSRIEKKTENSKTGQKK